MSEKISSLKQICSWILINLRVMNSALISYVNSFLEIQSSFHSFLHTGRSYNWIYRWIHNYEFIHDFITMNSTACIQKWVHKYEFWPIISQYSSWSWIHTWIHILNSYMISSSWIHILHFMTWIHIYIGQWGPWKIGDWLKTWFRFIDTHIEYHFFLQFILYNFFSII